MLLQQVRKQKALINNSYFTWEGGGGDSLLDGAYQRVSPQNACMLNVAKYHLGKVKLKRVGQQSCPLQYVTYGTAIRELQGSLCTLLLVLRCIVALLADRSGSIFAFL